MRIVTVQFDYPGKDYYNRLLKVFRNSVKVHMPEANFVQINVPAPVDLRVSKQSFASNSHKLRIWIDELQKSDQPTLLADCDMLMTRSLDDVWEKDFDIAYTEREESRLVFDTKPKKVNAVGVRKEPTSDDVDSMKPNTSLKPHPAWPGGIVGAIVTERKHQMNQKDLPTKRRGAEGLKPHPGLQKGKYIPAKYVTKDGRKIRKSGPKGVKQSIVKSVRWPPYNGGVMFIRPNDRSIEFMVRQLEVNNKMLADETFHAQYRRIYCGINQAAFGYMIENEFHLCNLISLPCSEWNACDATWLDHNERVRMIHIKSALRWMCVGKWLVQPGYEFLVDMWREYESMEVGV